MQGLAFF